MKKEGQISGTWANTNTGINVSLPIISFEDSGSIVYYCPALEVYGYGKTDAEAENSLYISMSEFFQYTLNKKTFFAELKRLGWTVKKTKKMTPPTMSQLLADNDNFSNVFNNFPFKKFDHKIAMPC
jgi:hypothetical protein